jgi:hypothetical protein
MYIWFDTLRKQVLQTQQEQAVFEDKKTALENAERFIESHFTEEVRRERYRDIELRSLEPTEEHYNADDALNSSYGEL